MCRIQASRSWPSGASSQTQPIQERSTLTKWVASRSGQPSTGCPAAAPPKCRTLSHTQLYAFRYALPSADAWTMTNVAGGVPSASGNSSGSRAYAACATAGSMPAGSAVTW